ncbi:MAG: hypothetical protein LBI26_02095, partial [Holosporales bacterium]|nr:hypothetical protein [Holosporales bacterium]
ENTGINSRVVFIGTAKDGTDFKKFYQRGIYKPEEENSENERWKSFTFKADDGELISKEEVNRIKMWMDKDIFEQEYNCNFEVCAGSEYIYYRELVKIEKNINSDITYDPAKPVYTSWDLGHGDFTVIWFYQVHGSELHFIDYYEGKHEHISTHAANILDKGYTHGKSLIPHDGIAHRVDTITTTEETLFEFGLRPVILKRTPNKWASIIESRLMLRRCYFNKEKCEVGLHHLKNFKRRVNKNTGIAEDNPIHDEHMDACDAFRYVSEGRAHWEHAQVIHDNDPNTYYNSDNYWY